VLINEVADSIAAPSARHATAALAKDHGFSDAQIAQLRGFGEAEVREVRHSLGVRPVYKTVDTCAGEFPALTPYHYSSYDLETEVAPSTAARSSSSAPARTASARASSSTTRACTRRSRCATPGFETIMINCNPETVSTDYDTSDRLYFEPLTLEDVLEVIHAESQSGELVGVVVQLGGQTALGLAKGSRRPACRSSARARGDRPRRGARAVLADPRRRGLLAPRNGTAIDVAGARARRRGHRLPGARAPELRARRTRHGDRLRHAVARGLLRPHRGPGIIAPGSPLLVDRFLDDAIEIDVDALYDGPSCTRRRHGAHRGGRHPLR
jgi:carbamoyl-phosphate synthase large subunit